jgi:hypothetical protein
MDLFVTDNADKRPMLRVAGAFGDGFPLAA